MSGSGISWAICKSAPCSRRTTTPASHHSYFLHAGCPSCRPTNSVKALKVTNGFSSSSRVIVFEQAVAHFCSEFVFLVAFTKSTGFGTRSNRIGLLRKLKGRCDHRKLFRGFTSQRSTGRNIASTPTNQDLPERLKSSCCSGSDEGDMHKRNCLKCWRFEHSQLTWYVLVHMNVLCACVIVSAWSHIYWCKYYWWTSMTVELKTNNIAFRIICFYSVASHEILPFCHFCIMKIHENYNRLQVLIWSK